MKAWVCRDNHEVAASLTMVVMFFGPVKPERGEDGVWRQHGLEGGRWPLPLSPFAPMVPGEIRRIKMERML